MTRDEAAAILGIAPDAGSAEVQRAFRQAVKSSHPDAVDSGDSGQRDPGRADSDLGDVAEARDVLLARTQATPQPTSPEPVSQTRPKPAPQAKPAVPVTDTVDQPVTPHSARTKASNAWLAIAAGLFGVIVFFLATLTVIALAFGDEAPTDIKRLDGGVSGSLDDCVVVRVETVAARPCTALNAQRIDSTIAGPGNCPVGTNTLDVGDTTYCLRPVTP